MQGTIWKSRHGGGSKLFRLRNTPGALGSTINVLTNRLTWYDRQIHLQKWWLGSLFCPGRASVLSLASKMHLQLLSQSRRHAPMLLLVVAMIRLTLSSGTFSQKCLLPHQCIPFFGRLVQMPRNLMQSPMERRIKLQDACTQFPLRSSILLQMKQQRLLRFRRLCILCSHRTGKSTHRLLCTQL